MLIEERINHVRYALDRREAILKSKIDRCFPVSVSVVSRRLYKVRSVREELDQIICASAYDYDEALGRLEKVEETLFGVL